MPEPGEQPIADNPAVAPEAKPKRKRAPANPDAKLAKLKKKYRLDETVKIVALGHDGKPLGRGPLLDDQVFKKFADLDTTPEKHYLDWMLYQAGGGPEAVKLSLENWGENTEPLDPNQVLSDWKNASRHEVRIDASDIANAVQNLSLTSLKSADRAIIAAASEQGDDPSRYEAIVNVLKERKVAPGEEDTAARAIMAHKLKKYVRNSGKIKVRDRIHTVINYMKFLRREPQEAWEPDWEANFARRKREFLMGDEDAVKGGFGFTRHWPGKEGRYEKVYNEMRQFLLNKARVEERTAMLDQWNADIRSRNAGLPPDQASPEREPIDVPLDIGAILLTKDFHLVYQGKFPRLSDLAKVNAQIADLPFRERVRGDVRYAGPKGKFGRSEKIYSDANLDVLVPLTVMAAIKSGHPSWDISDPSQLDDLTMNSHHSGSAWQRTHGNRGEGSAVTLFFVFKSPEMSEDFRKLRLTISMDDLANIPDLLGAFMITTKWGISKADSDEIDFRNLMKDMRANLSPEVYRAAASSVSKALIALRNWSKEFDPRYMVPDYATYHRDKLQGRRGLRDQIKFRAEQVIEQLLEA